VKVAIYCRVSRDEQDVGKQEKACREYCERTGNEVYAVYNDIGVSGMKESRPAFDRLLNDMRLFKFDCVMVTKLDRIGRSLQHILSLFEEFNRKSVHFIAVTQNIDTSSSMGKFQMQMLGAFAEFERNIISERTREGLKYKKSFKGRGPDKKPRKRRGVIRTPLFKKVKQENGTGNL
jgi:DNA invertase Pin-like site-specific DNA recombinase